MTYVDDDRIPQINTQTAKYIDVAEFIYNRLLTNRATLVDSNKLLQQVFEENRALFYSSMLASMGSYRDMDTEFSLLPMPKYSEDEERYVAPVNSIWCSSVCIPACVVDPERTGTILNVLSAFSVNTVNKTLYEVLLGAKLVRDEGMKEMLDYILANKQYCWGNGYSWSDGMSKVLQKQWTDNSFTVASGMQSVNKSSQKMLEQLLNKLDMQP